MYRAKRTTALERSTRIAWHEDCPNDSAYRRPAVVGVRAMFSRSEVAFDALITAPSSHNESTATLIEKTSYTLARKRVFHLPCDLIYRLIHLATLPLAHRCQLAPEQVTVQRTLTPGMLKVSLAADYEARVNLLGFSFSIHFTPSGSHSGEIVVK